MPGSHATPRTKNPSLSPVPVLTLLLTPARAVIAPLVRGVNRARPSVRTPSAAVLSLGPAMAVAIALSLPAVNAHVCFSPMGDKLGFKITRPAAFSPC